jgi:adenylate cyclase
MTDQSSSSHPLNAIARKFETRSLPQNQKTETRSSWPCLSPQPIQSPALLIDNELRVVWQNEAAWAHLWRRPEINESDAMVHLFDLLLASSFRNEVVNWRDWATFFIQQARPHDIQRICAQRDPAECELLMPLLNELQAGSNAVHQVHCLALLLGDTSNKITFSVVGTTFDKGRLLVFEHLDHGGDQSASRTQRRFSMIRSQSAPVQKRFFAMAVRLNKASILKAEMLDEDYSRLLHRLYGQVFETMEQNGGIVTQYTSEGLNGFFLPENESEPNPIFVIQCALELKHRMGELGREWKIRRGWLHDIELNIGIEAGSEYLLMLPNLFGENLIPAGDTVQVAACMAQMAADGQIWATKALINQVPSGDLKNIRFGIFHNENSRRVFIERSFIRIREFPAGEGLIMNIPDDFGIRPVTQIFDGTSES